MTNADKFNNAINTLNSAIAAAYSTVSEIIEDPNNVNIVDEVAETGTKITVLEPLLLQVHLNELLDRITDLSLVAYVKKHDPLGTRVTNTGVTWVTALQDSLEAQHVKINDVKAIREAFVPFQVDIKSARRIAELFIKGEIKY